MHVLVGTLKVEKCQFCPVGHAGIAQILSYQADCSGFEI